MDDEGAREREREEAVRKWRRRQVQDKARSEELEKESWRFSKYIKAKDDQHMVIMPKLKERLESLCVGMFLLGGGILFGFGLINNLNTWSLPHLIFFGIMSVFMAYCGIEVLLDVIRARATIDLSDRHITLITKKILMYKRRRVILFSDIISVNIDYVLETYHGSKYDNWKVSLNTNNGIIMMKNSEKEEDMYQLANGIASLIKKDVIVMSNKPADSGVGGIFAPTAIDQPHKRIPPDWRL